MTFLVQGVHQRLWCLSVSLMDEVCEGRRSDVCLQMRLEDEDPEVRSLASQAMWGGGAAVG